MTEGWYCPRCHKINAPWVPQCSCGDTNTNWNPDTGRVSNPWWKDVTCSTTTIIDDGTVTTFNDKATS